MKTSRFAASILATIAFLVLMPEPAKAGYPVIDAGHIAVSTQNAATAASNWMTNVGHKIETTLGWMNDQVQQLMHTGLIGDILALNEVMKLVQSEIMNAAGTLQDIAGIPQNIMEDITGVIGSVKDTIMGVAGVSGIFTDLQGTFTNVSEMESFGNYEDMLDFGDFNSAYGANRSMRGVRTRTSIQQLDMIEDERRSVERSIRTFETSSNAAEISKGHAQTTASLYREVARANELAALEVQAEAQLERAQEAVARAQAARAKASAGSVIFAPLR